MHQDLIDEFEAMAAPHDEGPVEPFVITHDSHIISEMANLLIDEWEDDIGRKSGVLLVRQRDEFACKRLFQMSPCPPWLFCAIHRRFKKRAEHFSSARPHTPPCSLDAAPVRL